MMKIPCLPPSDGVFEKAAKLIRQGRLVAFPTETVYGLGGNAADDRAVAAIYEAKGRPTFNPLIIHVVSREMARRYVDFPPLAKKLMAAFWPGPLTLVMPRRAGSEISLLASAGLDTLAIRFPSHPVAQELIRRVDLPIAAPSANASGRLSPTEAGHVAESLAGKIDLIIDGGRTEVGVESTVLDLSEETPTLLRPGGVTREQIEALVGPIRAADSDPDAPKSPGQLSSHYAPAALVRLDARSAEKNEAFLTFGPDRALIGGGTRLNLSPRGDLAEAAANLFAMMRELDHTHPRAIAVAPIPEEGLGLAILDRLRRAASPRG
jgi:L-threonylcarbamoyladenylate synthase